MSQTIDQTAGTADDPDRTIVPGAATPPPAPGAPGRRTRQAARPARAPRPQQEGTPAQLSSAATMIAIVALWMLAQMLFLSGASHDRDQALLYKQFRNELSQTTAPLGPIVEPGSPVAILKIPAVDVEEVVVEGTASGDLLAGPGHRRDTVLPGQEGVSVTYGRATTYGGPFGSIGDLTEGDTITVITSQGEKDLTVTAVRREGDPVAPPAPGVGRITLTSAEGDGPLAVLTPDEVVYVDAETDEPFPTPSGRLSAVPESEKAMGTDSTVLPLLALCLALLLGLTVAVILARARWSAVLVWVVASPVAMALAWATTDTVMRLLPNLI